MDRELKARALEFAEEAFKAGQRNIIETFADKLGVVAGIPKKRGRKAGKGGKRSGPTLKTKITAALKKSSKPLSAAEIVAATKGNKSSVNGALFQMKKAKEIKQPKRGLWAA